MDEDLRVFVVASFTSASAGGEAILPWHYFVELRRRGVDAHLVTRARTQDELMALEPTMSAAMHFVPDTTLVSLLDAAAAPFPLRIRSVLLWPVVTLVIERHLRRVLTRLVSEFPGSAVVHQPVPVSPRAPSPIADIGAPVVIGPLNGGMTYPAGFIGQVTRGERLARWLARRAAEAANQLLRGKPRAALLLVANDRTRKALPHSTRGVRVEQLVENGVDLSLFAYQERGETRRRFAFVGRLVEWKRVDLALDALARTPPNYRLDVCGSGPVQDALEAQARRLGVSDRVVFHGFLSQAACAEILADCDALLLPSIYECGGAVVLEAMAAGVPVIATDWGGPSEYLDGETAILVPPTSPESVISGFATGMQRLGEDKELVQRMGRAGHRRVEQSYTWDKKIDTIRALYASCVR